VRWYRWKLLVKSKKKLITPTTAASRDIICTAVFQTVKYLQAWAAQPGGVGGTMSPTFGTRGYSGVQGSGPMKMIFASTADSLYTVVYM